MKIVFIDPEWECLNVISVKDEDFSEWMELKGYSKDDYELDTYALRDEFVVDTLKSLDFSDKVAEFAQYLVLESKDALCVDKISIVDGKRKHDMSFI